MKSALKISARRPLKKYEKGGALTPFEKAFAEARAKKEGTFNYKGKVYTTQYKEEVSTKSTPSATSFDKVFAAEREKLGPGKTFTYNGKQYSTNYATEVSGTTQKTTQTPKTETKPASKIVEKSKKNKVESSPRANKVNSKNKTSDKTKRPVSVSKETDLVDFPQVNKKPVQAAAPKKRMNTRGGVDLIEFPAGGKKPAVVTQRTDRITPKDTTDTAQLPVATVTASKLSKPTTVKKDTTFTSTVNPVDVTAKKINRDRVSKMSMLPDFTEIQQPKKESAVKRKSDVGEQIYELSDKPKKQYKPGDKIKIKNYLSEKGYDEVTIPDYPSFSEYFAKVPNKNVHVSRIKDDWHLNMPETYRRFVWTPNAEKVLKESKQLFLKTGFDLSIDKNENKDVGKFQKQMGLPLTTTQKHKQKLINERRRLGLQNGGTLNTLSGVASAAGGVASALPGIGPIVGAALNSVVAPVLGALAAKQQKRDNINQLYSNISIMEKGGPIDPPTKRGSLVYPSGYAPTVTGYPTASPVADYSKAKSFGDAFSKARAAGESSFRYNNKMYSTRKDTDDIKLTPEVIKMYGDINKILNKEYPELKKLLNRGTPVNKLEYTKDRAMWLPSGINVGKTRLGKNEDPTSMLEIFNLPAELAHHEQFTNLPAGKRMLKSANLVKERLKYGDPGVYYKKGTIENEAHSQWEPAIELTARGNLTPEYIKQVQRKLGFTGKDVDGILGPKTYGKLVSAAGLSKKVLDNPEGRGDMEEGTDVLPKILKTMQNMVDMGSLQKTTSNETFIPEKAKGGLIKRKDGSYSKRGLWDNIRANKGSGKKPTKEMLEQERKIKASKEFGGTITGNSDLSFYKGKSHRDGGIMVNSKGVPSRNASAEVEGGETRFMYKDKAYIFSDKLTV